MWIWFLFVVIEMIDVVNNGVIGELMGIQGDVFVLCDYDFDDCFFFLVLGGGVIFDFSVYVFDFVICFFGEFIEVIVCGNYFFNGVDFDVLMLWIFLKNKFVMLVILFIFDGVGCMII